MSDNVEKNEGQNVTENQNNKEKIQPSEHMLAGEVPPVPEDSHRESESPELSHPTIDSSDSTRNASTSTSTDSALQNTLRDSDTLDLSDQSESSSIEMVKSPMNKLDEKSTPQKTAFSSSKKQISENNDKKEGQEKSERKTFREKEQPSFLSQILPTAKSGKIVMAVLALGSVCAIGLGILTSSQSNKIEDLSAQVATLNATEQSLQEKNEALTKQLDKANSELDEIKNGKDALLSQAHLAYEKQDYTTVLSVSDQIHEKYYGTQQDKEAQQLRDQAQAKINEADEAERKRKEEEARKKAEEEARGYETGITYDQLARDPETYKGKKVKFTGEVIQVMKEDGSIIIRLAVDSNYDQVIMGYLDSSLIQGNLLEDDIITIYGTSGGEFSYEAVWGNEIYLPLVLVDKVDQ